MSKKTDIPAVLSAKIEADNLRKMFAEAGVIIKATDALQKISKIKNYENWETYRSVLEKEGKNNFIKTENNKVEIKGMVPFTYTYENSRPDYSTLIEGFEPVHLIGHNGAIQIDQDYKDENECVIVTNPTDAKKIGEAFIQWANMEEKRLENMRTGADLVRVEPNVIEYDPNEAFQTKYGETFWCGPVGVSLEEIGEGYGGDYNPDDPEDRSLLRLDLSVYVDGEFLELSCGSVCTGIVADDTPYYRRQLILEQVMCWVYPEVMEGRSEKHIMETLSGIDESWDYTLKNRQGISERAPSREVVANEKNWGKFVEGVSIGGDKIAVKEMARPKKRMK